jgi:threonine/homoserine/homoserine lactone efflux protein
MEFAGSLASILAVLIVGVMSPGPSFPLVAQTAVGQSRRAAMASALGMAAGATVLCCLALLGLHALFQQFPGACLVLKIVGALYLLRIAYKMWAIATSGEAFPRQAPRATLVRDGGALHKLGLK